MDGGGWVRSIAALDRAQFSVPTGLRCATGLALPLVVGIGTGHVRGAGWGAVGAFLTDMAMAQPGHRFRARIVAGAAAAVAIGGVVGALSGIDGWIIFPLVALWTAAAGLLVTIGPTASLVAVSSTVGLLYSASFQVSAVQSLEVGAWMLAAGLGSAFVGWCSHRIRGGRPGRSIDTERAQLTGRQWLLNAVRSLRRGTFHHSLAVHHASRLTVATLVATVLYRVMNQLDGFWIPEATLFIGRPDADLTRLRSAQRVLGTVAGATLTTLLLVTLRPTSTGLATIAVAASAFAFSVQRVNFGLYITFVTVIFVVLTAFGGVPAQEAVVNRLEYNVIGAAIAVMSLVLWPGGLRTAPSSLREQRLLARQLPLGEFRPGRCPLSRRLRCATRTAAAPPRSGPSVRSK